MWAFLSAPKAATGELLRRTGLSYRRIDEVCDLQAGVVLGKGAFGTVHRAALKAPSREAVAVKVLDKRQMRRQRVTKKLVLEEVALMKLCRGQERFVQIHDFLEGRSAYYIVMELCTGGNLEQAVHSWWEREPLGEPHVARLMAQLLEGVRFLHAKSVWHRDIKPQNLILGSADRDAAELKISDFGIAKHVPRAGLLTEKLGTPAFMAPEQHQLPSRSSGYDHKVDIWASGVTMVFLLAHELPFLDARGVLIREQLLKGEVPLWGSDAFSGLFRWLGGAVGLTRPSPSQGGQDLVRLLLSPRRSERPEAARALQHEWFAAKPQGPAAQGEGRQYWDEFARDVAASVEQEVQQLASRVLDTVGQVQRALGGAPDPAGPAETCGACRAAVRPADWRCPACESWACARCLAGHPRAACLLCAHADHGASLSRALGLAELELDAELAPTILEAAHSRAAGGKDPSAPAPARRASQPAPGGRPGRARVRVVSEGRSRSSPMSWLRRPSRSQSAPRSGSRPPGGPPRDAARQGARERLRAQGWGAKLAAAAGCLSAPRDAREASRPRPRGAAPEATIAGLAAAALPLALGARAPQGGRQQLAANVAAAAVPQALAAQGLAAQGRQGLWRR